MSIDTSQVHKLARDLELLPPKMAAAVREVNSHAGAKMKNRARANVHVKVLYGRSSHHRIEAVFKAFARALRVACSKDKQLARMLPSTKGLL